MRRGLRPISERESNFNHCAEPATYQKGLETVAASKANIVIVGCPLATMMVNRMVVDIELGGSNGLNLIKYMHKHNPKNPALMLSMHDEALYAERSFKAGARGYVNKQQLDETLLIAIRRLLDGETYMTDKLMARLATKFIGGKILETDSTVDVLSDRELQVFRFLGQGRSTREIAKTLHLSIRSIESHREHIKQTLTFESATELAQRATQWVEIGRGPRIQSNPVEN